MTGELTIFGGNGTALSEVQQSILAEMKSEAERHAFEFSPTRIKLPAGGLMVFTTSDGDTLQPFTGVIAVAQMARAYWPTKTSSGAPPLCSSPDSMQGWLADAPPQEQVQEALRQVAVHPGIAYAEDYKGPFECSTCALSAWGTGSGRGQACKTLRRLLVLVEGWTAPAVLTLPPTSCKVFDTFASARASRGGRAYFSCKTRFELEKKTNGQGIAYSVIKLSAAGELTDQEQAAVLGIRARYAELVRTMEIEAAEYEEIPA